MTASVPVSCRQMLEASTFSSVCFSSKISCNIVCQHIFITYSCCTYRTRPTKYKIMYNTGTNASGYNGDRCAYLFLHSKIKQQYLRLRLELQFLLGLLRLQQENVCCQELEQHTKESLPVLELPVWAPSCTHTE